MLETILYINSYEMAEVDWMLADLKLKKKCSRRQHGYQLVVYFNQLLGVACTQRLWELFFVSRHVSCSLTVFLLVIECIAFCVN